MGSILYIGTIFILLCSQESQTGLWGLNCSQAIDDAKRNAAINDIHNVEFMGKVKKSCCRLMNVSNIHADIIVVDLPEKGRDESLLACITQMQPKRVVYVSCDPATLARDLKYLEEWIIRSRGSVLICSALVHGETIFPIGEE